MRNQVSFLTQSRFYSPAFNAAIFDGPFRIYFAQFQENLALKIYFAAQQRLKEALNALENVFQKDEVNIFVMLYPSNESFQMSFDGNTSDDDIVVDRLGSDFIVGVRGPIGEDDCERVYERVEELARKLA